MTRYPLAVFIAAAFLSSPCLAQTAVDVYANPLEYAARTEALRTGEPAPEVRVSEWIGGQPADLFQPGTAYVVEFMASWCAPCQKSLPHLSELADYYQDQSVQIIGVAAAELDGAAELSELVRVRHDSIRFPIAYVDHPQTYRNWMEAGRTFGLPWVFVVDRKGLIAWWGQPFYADFEPALAAVVAGDHAQLSKLQQSLSVPELASQGWQLAAELKSARAAEQWYRALELIEELRQVDEQRYWWEQVQALEILEERLNQPEKVLAGATKMLGSRLSDNPHAMTALSELLLANPDDRRRLNLAMHSIGRASALTHGKNASVEEIRLRIDSLSRRTD